MSPLDDDSGETTPVAVQLEGWMPPFARIYLSGWVGNCIACYIGRAPGGSAGRLAEWPVLLLTTTGPPARRGRP
jgi:hypothetical protein